MVSVSPAGRNAAGRYARHRNAAIALCIGALVVDARAESDRDGGAVPFAAYDEEVVVTADRLEKGAMPTQTIMVRTYNVLRRGKRLYSERRYAEALPYLVMTAKRGFKWAQAMAADIYLHGRGGGSARHRKGDGVAWRRRATADGTADPDLLPPSAPRDVAEAEGAHRGCRSPVPRRVECPGLACVVPPDRVRIASRMGRHESTPEQADALHIRRRDPSVPGTVWR